MSLDLENKDKLSLLQKEFLIGIGILFLVLCVSMVHALWLDHSCWIGRIDFETPVQSEKPFDVYVLSDRVARFPKEEKLNWDPWWLEHSNIYGRVFESDKKEVHLDIHVYQPCRIKIRLVGSHCEDWKLHRLNPKVVFSSFKINKQEILPEVQTVWHDQPFIHEFDVVPGIVQIDAIWDRPVNEEKQ